MSGTLELRRGARLLIGVVHLRPLPGSPRASGSMDEVLEWAERDARALAEGGADGVIVENFGDTPFHAEHVPAETVAAMALAAAAVRSAAPALPLGVNVLRNDARAAVGLCAATGASFFRVNVHVGAAVTDQGVVEGRAADTLRERDRLAPGALLLADVHVKHARPLGGGAIADEAEEAHERAMADALIVSGRATGEGVDRGDLLAVRERLPEAPLLVGSGLSDANAADLLSVADGAIVGTWIKEGGRLESAVDPRRLERLRAALS
jgi:membrane complex biogenesis BtpA family protein